MSEVLRLAAGSSRESSDASISFDAYGSEVFESASVSDEQEHAYEDDAFEDDEGSLATADDLGGDRDVHLAKFEKDEAGFLECDLVAEQKDSIPTAKARENCSEEVPFSREHEEINTRIQDQSTQNGTLIQVGSWCREKLQVLQKQRPSHERSPNLPPAQKKSNPMLPQRLITSLSLRFEERKANTKANHHRSHFKFNTKSLSIPTALMNRARVGRLASTGSDEEVKHIRIVQRSRSHKTMSASINTFCSVKRAELQGRLASQKLHDRCSKWETGDGGDGTSLAVVAFMTESIANQRKALHGDESVIPSFQASFRRESLVKATTKQLQASVALRKQALAVLSTNHQASIK